MRRTKIVCTIGPASEAPNMIARLIDAGMNVARLNFSHSQREEHLGRIKTIRQVAADKGAHIGIMLDTRGPEIRTGKLAHGEVLLKAGQKFFLTTRDVTGDENGVSVNYGGLADEVGTGDRILLSDGLIELIVEEVKDQDILCQVINGGKLGERKGVNVPGVSLGIPFLSDRDREDILFGLEHGIDFIAASFVGTPDDVIAIKKLVEQSGREVDVIAKIESRQALGNLEGIIRVADGIMVARGDLGVEVATEEVPLVQKRVLEECHRLGKYAIVATQMLESMTVNPRPTRAEASDVANAVFEGADAIMLSAESAAGRYPAEAVATMARIAVRAESALDYEETLRRKKSEGVSSVPDAISYACCTAAMDLNAAAIITATRSGSTAHLVSRYRPRSPIVAATTVAEVARRLTIVWGVTPILIKNTAHTDEMIEEATRAAHEAGLVKGGDMVVVTAGIPRGVRGSTNFLKVHIVGEIMVKGIGIGKQVVTGRVHVVSDPNDSGLVNGDIMVAVSTDASMVPLMSRASAVIVEAGGLTSHAAIVGISMGIPVVVGAEGATRILKDGMVVTVDTPRGQVYLGERNEGDHLA